MSNKTKIEWCDSTASPWKSGKPLHKFKTFRATCRKRNRYLTCDCGAVKILADLPTNIAACPVCKSAYRKQRIFPSRMDWLDPEVPIEWLAEFLQVIYECPNLDFLLLTKRPENFTNRLLKVGALHSVDTDGNPLAAWLADWHGNEPPPNVWIGVSVEERIPELLKIPAKVRFLSCDSLLIIEQQKVILQK